MKTLFAFALGLAMLGGTPRHYEVSPTHDRDFSVHAPKQAEWELDRTFCMGMTLSAMPCAPARNLDTGEVVQVCRMFSPTGDCVFWIKDRNQSVTLRMGTMAKVEFPGGPSFTARCPVGYGPGWNRDDPDDPLPDGVRPMDR